MLTPDRIGEFLRTVQGDGVAPFLLRPKQPIPLTKLVVEPLTDPDFADRQLLLSEFSSDMLFHAGWGFSEFTLSATRVTQSRPPLTLYVATSTALAGDGDFVVAWREGVSPGTDDKLFLQLFVSSNGKLFGMEMLGGAPRSVWSVLEDDELEIALLSGLSWAASQFGHEVWDEFYPAEELDGDEEVESQPLSAWLKGSIRRLS